MNSGRSSPSPGAPASPRKTHRSTPSSSSLSYTTLHPFASPGPANLERSPTFGNFDFKPTSVGMTVSNSNSGAKDYEEVQNKTFCKWSLASSFLVARGSTDAPTTQAERETRSQRFRAPHRPRDRLLRWNSTHSTDRQSHPSLDPSRSYASSAYSRSFWLAAGSIDRNAVPSLQQIVLAPQGSEGGEPQSRPRQDQGNGCPSHQHRSGRFVVVTHQNRMQPISISRTKAVNV